MGTLRRSVKRLWTHDATALSMLLAIALLVWGFVELAGEVTEGSTEEVEIKILKAFRNPDDLGDPLGPVWAEEMVRDLTALGSSVFVLLLTIAVAGYLGMSDKKRAMWFLLIAVVGGVLVSHGLKEFFGRQRPDVVPRLADPLSLSFPSGHSMGSAVVYLTVGMLLARTAERRRIKVFSIFFAALMTVLVGMSRIYMGVHWPTDVIGGWALGCAWALLCYFVFRWMQQHGQVETAGPEPVPPEEREE